LTTLLNINFPCDRYSQYGNALKRQLLKANQKVKEKSSTVKGS